MYFKTIKKSLTCSRVFSKKNKYYIEYFVGGMCVGGHGSGIVLKTPMDCELIIKALNDMDIVFVK